MDSFLDVFKKVGKCARKHICGTMLYGVCPYAFSQFDSFVFIPQKFFYCRSQMNEK